jgi:hypothetical protein
MTRPTTHKRTLSTRSKKMVSFTTRRYWQVGRTTPLDYPSCSQGIKTSALSKRRMRPYGFKCPSTLTRHVDSQFGFIRPRRRLSCRLAPSQVLAPGLTPKAVLEKLATIQMLDVWFPTTDGRWLVMPRSTQPEADQAILLHKLKLELPQQPPPRIKARVPEFPPKALRL